MGRDIPPFFHFSKTASDSVYRFGAFFAQVEIVVRRAERFVDYKSKRPAVRIVLRAVVTVGVARQQAQQIFRQRQVI